MNPNVIKNWESKRLEFDQYMKEKVSTFENIHNKMLKDQEDNTNRRVAEFTNSYKPLLEKLSNDELGHICNLFTKEQEIMINIISTSSEKQQEIILQLSSDNTNQCLATCTNLQTEVESKNTNFLTNVVTKLHKAENTPANKNKNTWKTLRYSMEKHILN